MNKMIEIKGLNKSFGQIKAVNDLSFEVRKGELFAFLGVNGAGKSTTIAILCGQLAKDSGTVKICGKECDGRALAKELGVVFQNSVLDQKLSVYDNLKSRAALYGITGKPFNTRLKQMTQMLGLEEILKRQVCKLSGGQRRRVDIARALFHNPQILILDEPTTGLDPQTRRLLWNVIERLRKDDGLTVLLTTHYMEETTDADYCVIIDSGVTVAEGSPIELKNAHAGDYITLYGVDEKDVTQLNLPYEVGKGLIRIKVENTQCATQLVLRYPELFCDYEITKGKMDDVFLSVTGKKLEGVTR